MAEITTDREKPFGDLAFDIKCPKNRRLYFAPARGVLAGELDINEFRTDKPPGTIVNVGGRIPGYRIEVNTKRKRVRVIDRLKMRDNRPILERIRDQMNTERNGYRVLADNWRRDPAESLDEFERQLNDDSPADTLQTWLWHLRKCVDAGRLQVVRGELPSRDQIRRMGPIWTGDNFGRSRIDGKPQNILEPPDEKKPGRSNQTAS